MIRYLSMIMVMFFLCACAQKNEPDPIAKPVIKETAPKFKRSEKAANVAFNRVSGRVIPIAKETCMEMREKLREGFCDFSVASSENAEIDAYGILVIDRERRPVITIPTSTLRTIENDHLLAYMIAHLAGHRVELHPIRAHIQKEGVVIYNKVMEDEAKAIAKKIVMAANYSPLIGERLFNQFEAEHKIDLE